MITQAGDLGVILDTGTNQPGVSLERFEAGEWKPFTMDGEPVLWPVKLESLRPGRYRDRAPSAGKQIVQPVAGRAQTCGQFG